MVKCVSIKGYFILFPYILYLYTVFCFEYNIQVCPSHETCVTPGLVKKITVGVVGLAIDLLNTNTNTCLQAHLSEAIEWVFHSYRCLHDMILHKFIGCMHATFDRLLWWCLASQQESPSLSNNCKNVPCIELCDLAIHIMLLPSLNHLHNLPTKQKERKVNFHSLLFDQ